MSRIPSGAHYLVVIPVIGLVVTAPFYFLLGNFGRIRLREILPYLSFPNSPGKHRSPIGTCSL